MGAAAPTGTPTRTSTAHEHLPHRRHRHRRVVSARGHRTRELAALLDGASGASTLEYDWVEQYQLPVTFAAQAKVRPDTVLERPVAKRLDPSSQFALVAAMEAWADAGSPEVEPERLGVDFATGIGGLWTLLDAWDTLREKGPRRVLPMTVPMLMPNAAAGNLSLHFNARAYARTVASACASSTESIVNAVEHLRAGSPMS